MTPPISWILYRMCICHHSLFQVYAPYLQV